MVETQGGTDVGGSRQTYEGGSMDDMTMSDEERRLFSQWTEVDGDIGPEPTAIERMAVSSRVGTARLDNTRRPYWSVPEGIDCINDIPYVDDGSRPHLLDLYLPHESAVRAGRTTPVYIDIHGGGFVYGYKELNRNFCTHLAKEGFAVFSLNYGLAPRKDFMDQLRDVNLALAWIRDHMGEYPVDPGKVFLTGDSAGGTLGLYTLAVECSRDFAQAIGIVPSGLHFTGGAFISGLFDLTGYVDLTEGDFDRTGSPVDTLAFMSPWFFRSFGATGARRYVDLDRMAGQVDLPPLFLNTSSDDFIQDNSLALALALSRQGKVFELHDVRPGKGVSLGHVYPVCMSWLEESQETLERIRRFSYDLI